MNDDNLIDLTSDSSVSAYDWYDYQEVIHREDTIINNQNTMITTQNKTHELINDGLTFLSFMCVVVFLYIFIKNLIRK